MLVVSILVMTMKRMHHQRTLNVPGITQYCWVPDIPVFSITINVLYGGCKEFPQNVHFICCTIFKYFCFSFFINWKKENCSFFSCIDSNNCISISRYDVSQDWIFLSLLIAAIIIWDQWTKRMRETMGQFHQRYTSSFYVRRSQKCKKYSKAISLFCTFWNLSL